MRLVVVGAGGIGGYYGARLQAAGHAVTFVARGAHLEAMRRNGLTVEHPDFAFHAAVDACDLGAVAARAPGDTDAVLLCVKSMATAQIAQRLATWLGAREVPVLSLQNGVDNEIQLAAALGPERVLGGIARRIGGHVVAPGRIEATGRAEVILGPWPRRTEAPSSLDSQARALAETFAGAGIPTEVSEDIRRELWRKLLLNNALNPLSAIVRRDTRTLSHERLLAPVVAAMMRETARAAAADGVALGEADVEEMLALIRSFDPIKTSMLVDLEHGRALELDAIAGAVLDRAARLGFEAPYTRAAYAILAHLAPR